ncbi:DNA mismatch repair protein [Mucilaginibacter sp. SG564]|uniref:MutS-related protein n=1 Tax=Mucilaginibacter sp. SG564 TaxID=2587022 RepID=UPI0015574EA1|nr:DNA mismatch repair protein [Mucilaginibacter sp. SG564]NOW94996.1 DNA mismatch repair ATPase MutS [Mucilaginibacter sp. SG564]
MSFITDKQTLDDLNILGKYKPGSMFNLFNTGQTAGGERLLEDMFRFPLSDADLINRRSRIFQFFRSHALTFPFDQDQLTQMESYLQDSGEHTLLETGLRVIRKLVSAWLLKDEPYAVMQAGLLATTAVLQTCQVLLDKLNIQDRQHPYFDQVAAVGDILNDSRLAWIKTEKEAIPLSFLHVIRYDHLLRKILKNELNIILSFIYHFDVCLAVNQVAIANELSFGVALPASRNRMEAANLRHPTIKKAVGNVLSLSENTNLIFLTGANMAGKSTLMKAFGITMYLAHMGFPVAAESLEFSVKDGIYTSINVPDNLNMGYSHFYAEVLRVKKIAEKVSQGENMIIIFDELFKGTNVKDAYEATLAVTEAFASYRCCFFMISTHIIEVAEALKTICHNIRFAYLPTVMSGNVPTYTYRLEQGVTSDRQGMMIIENEKILEILYSDQGLHPNT